MLCPICDIQLSRPTIESKQHACCPRCASKLYKGNNLTPHKQLALSITGMLLLMVAYTQPLLEMDMYGIYGSASIIEGVLRLFHQQFYFVAILVALCAVIAPVLFLLLVFFISLSLVLNRSGEWLKLLLTWLSWSIHWSMLEVYLVGFLVSVFKLSSMADLSFGYGIIAFVLLILVNSTIISHLDLHCYWEAAHGSAKK